MDDYIGKEWDFCGGVQKGENDGSYLISRANVSRVPKAQYNNNE